MVQKKKHAVFSLCLSHFNFIIIIISRSTAKEIKEILLPLVLTLRVVRVFDINFFGFFFSLVVDVKKTIWLCRRLKQTFDVSFYKFHCKKITPYQT